MTNKIHGTESRPIKLGNGAAVPHGRDATSDATRSSSSSATGGVKITEGARQLAALERAVADVPVVNQGKVQHVSKAISEGRYQVRSDRIADKLLRMDQHLADAQRKEK